MSISIVVFLMSLAIPLIVFIGVATAIPPDGPQLASKPLTWFILAPQVRKHYDNDELRRLGESMKAQGQLQAVGAKPDGTLLWGHRRLLAARLLGLKELQVIITHRQMTDTEIRLVQLTENLHRSDLSGHEKFQACAELMCGNPTWQMKDLAEHLHLDPSMVTRLLSPSKCIPAWQAALAAGEVGISDCYAASKLEPEAQANLLSLKLGGASRDAIEQAGRSSRNGTAPAVRVQKVKCILPNGVNVAVSGEGVSLSEAIQALGEAIKEMKKAHEQGLDAKTFQAVMKDKAKKG